MIASDIVLNENSSLSFLTTPVSNSRRKVVIVAVRKTRGLLARMQVVEKG